MKSVRQLILIAIIAFVSITFNVGTSFGEQKNEKPPVNIPLLKGIGLYPFVYPVMAPKISSGYGMRVHPLLRFSRKHKGIDLAADEHAPIRAVAGGKVVFADPYAGYGNLIVLEHKKGVTTHYAHCAAISAKTGDTVQAGAIIGTIGSTGHSTGPHLHFEIRVNAIAYNPEVFIPDLADFAEG